MKKYFLLLAPSLFFIINSYLYCSEKPSTNTGSFIKNNNAVMNGELVHGNLPESKNSNLSPEQVRQLLDEKGNPLFSSNGASSDSSESDAIQMYSFNGFAAGDEFGTSVSDAGDVNGDGYDDIIAGAPNNDAGGNNAGRAYIYFGGIAINSIPDVVITGSTLNLFLGNAVSSAGDVNNDGYDDVIVSEINSSKVYLYYGGAAMDNIPDLTFSSTYSGGFGFSLSSAGDVNRDGFSDIIIGEYAASVNSIYDGRAYIFLGGVSMNNTADVIFTGEAANNLFGYSVSSAGDVNGDGYSDVIVGAIGYSSNNGKAYLYLGGLNMNNTADVTFTGSSVERLGWSVSDAGDVNNDGYCDVIISAPYYNVVSSSEGAAFIFLGSSVMNNTPDVTFYGSEYQDLFGYSVSSAGDINDDGYSDVIVGAVDNNAGGVDAGRAYVYYGSTGMNTTADAVFTGTGANDYFGICVSYAGDLNGDGYDDMIVGARENDDGGIDAGKAYVYTNTVNVSQLPSLKFTGTSANENLGSSVSDAGDVNGDGYDDIIVGIPNSVYTYIYFGGKFMDVNADVVLGGSSNFANRVAGAGDVNNDGYDDVMTSDPGFLGLGAVYIYFGGANMDGTVDVDFYGESAGDQFGYAISTAGDVNNDNYCDIIVGAPFNDAIQSDAGRAYIFYGGSVMNNLPDVILSGENYQDRFGFSVSDAGKINTDAVSDVIVGAPYYSGGFDYGRAYIYYGGTSMDNTADMIMTGTFLELFGYALESAGDVNGDSYNDLLISGIHADNNQGKAYIFYGGILLNNTADVTLTGDGPSYNFGGSVSSIGDINKDGYGDVLIGEAFNMYAGYYRGRATVFYGGAAMNNVADRIIYGEAVDDRFGYSVSKAGDVDGDGVSDFISGAYGNDAGGTDAGRAYLFISSNTGTDITDEFFKGAATGDQFGYSVASAGDINGDGYSDVIAGAPMNDAGGVNAGRAYIFFGGVPMDYIADVILTGEAAGDDFGISVSSAGDVNGDGYNDVIVGADFNDAGGTDAGRAYIFFGGNVVNNSPDVILTGALSGDRFGFSVSTAGNVNGDNIGDIWSDVIVGAPFNDAAGVNSGRAYIYFGSPVMNNTADVIMTGAASGYWFGISVSSAGYLNGDLYSDVIVGASMHDATGFNPGKAYIFHGGSSMDNTADMTLTGEFGNDQFGYSVSRAGNVNGDVYDDVIVGAYNQMHNGSGTDIYGAAYIYSGGTSMSNIPDVFLYGAETNDFFGVSVASAGDVNADGIGDVVVGASNNDAGGINSGRAYIYYGSSQMDNICDIVLTGNSPFQNFGWSVASAGDVNGDSQSDIITGADYIDGGGSDPGRAYLFINTHPSEHLILTLKLIQQGFYNTGPDNLNLSDTIKIYLHSKISPYNKIDSAKGVINKNTFTGKFYFNHAGSKDYFLDIRHRNSIQTWSMIPLNLIKNVNVNFDFTDIYTKAYGNNLKQVDLSPLRYGIFGGDQNQDGAVDAADVLAIFNDANNFLKGYVKTDITGDYNVDFSDVLIAYNNSAGFVVKITP